MPKKNRKNKKRVNPSVTIIQNVRSKNTQIGNENVMHDYDRHSPTPDSSKDLQGATAIDPNSGYHRRTRQWSGNSDRHTENVIQQNIEAKNVSITIKQNDWFDNEGFSRPNDVKKFLDSVDCFSKGHFILIVDRITGIENLEVFSLVDWVLVLDFDPESRLSGLLSYCEESVSKKRSLHIVSWQEEKCTFTDNSLYWVGMKGCSDQPETRTIDDFLGWKRQIKTKFGQQLKQLKRFGDAYTNLTVVVLWPSKSINYKHVHYVLNEISDTLDPKKVVIVEDGSRKTKEASSALTMLDDFNVVQMKIPEICKIIANFCAPLSMENSSGFQLPTSDMTHIPEIDDQKAQWLKEDLDVLYLDNKTGTEHDSESLQKEEETFFKGGTLPWSWWYADAGRVDIQRDITRELVNYIKSRHISLCRSGIITLFHNPGSGGTTLSQRVVWTLNEDVPCVQVKHRYGSTINEIADKIDFLSDKTRMPVLVLVDGGDKQKVESVQRILGGHCCVIILYVERYRSKIDSDKSNMKQGVFWLKSRVSAKEAENLRHLYTKLWFNDAQRRNINYLVKQVTECKSHSFFDFGFAIHSYEYRGIESYVKGYLNADNEGKSKQNVQPWQKALAYLSLVYFYGQTSLPCKFLASIIDPENAYKMTTYADFPDEMKELMVQDVQDRRTNVVRVAHYYIAKEILDQVLVYPMPVEPHQASSLSIESKKRLGKFAVEFIKTAGEINHEEQYTAISYIMTRTFILRDNKAVGENETQVTTKRQKFSQILEDVCSTRPYTERFDIYQALADSFPFEAQFRAHLGRLYTICRPEELDHAEDCFKEALQISEAEVLGMKEDDMPNSNKMDLMHIYHMYGNMILNRVSNYTGKFLGDEAKMQSDSSFGEIAEKLLKDVKDACTLFSKCRNITPIGCEESFGYIGEIQVRLMFCDYVHRNSGCKRGVCQYANEKAGEIAAFVNECMVVVDELFLLCFSNIEPEKMDRNVLNCQRWYSALFKHIPGNFVHKQEDDAMSRRLEIAKVKMKYCLPESYGILEHVDNVHDVEFIVGELEKNFRDYESFQNKVPGIHISKRAMDLDYREWLFAIRHSLFDLNYPIEKVLQQVQIWHDLLHTPYSWFYLFVLKSLLGFGNQECSGDSALLSDALNCKDEMLKRSKHVTKPRYPREWLGNPVNNIRRLVSGKRFFGQVEGRDIRGVDFDTLDIQKGTICAPNDRPAGGFINIDLGPHNRIPLKVFFVPARSRDNLKGPSYKNARVEFVIGFSLSHGYEAYNVRLIEHQKCYKCKQNVEKRSCDARVECPRCHIQIRCEEINKYKLPRNGSNKT